MLRKVIPFHATRCRGFRCLARPTALRRSSANKGHPRKAQKARPRLPCRAPAARRSVHRLTKQNRASTCCSFLMAVGKRQQRPRESFARARTSQKSPSNPARERMKPEHQLLRVANAHPRTSSLGPHQPQKLKSVGAHCSDLLCDSQRAL